MSLVAIFLFSLLLILPLQNECSDVKPEPEPEPESEPKPKPKPDDPLNAEERQALVDFFHNVPNNTTWNTSEPACSWKGVTCNPNNITVLWLKLPARRLVGNIPFNTIGRLTSLRVLSLRVNRLSGDLPLDFSNLTSLTHLSLNNNIFSGTIPSGFSNFTELIRLDLSDNKFTGQLPCINAKGLNIYNVSFNKLNTSIPRSLSKFPKILFSENVFLCGAPSKNACTGSYPPLCPIDHEPIKINPKKTPEILGISVGSGLLVLVLICCVRNRIHQQTKQPPKPILYKERNNLVALDEGIYHLDLEDLLNASAVVLGEGSVGRSYKQVLEGKNTTVVVKRLIRDVVVTANEFRTTVEGLGKMKNENVVPLRAYYYSKHEKWLVYDYMPDGSLYDRLHGSTASGQTHFDWDHHMRIALNAAKGLKYLHEAGKVHGNIKSTNILLRQETNNEASLSDYGLNRLFDKSSPIDYQVIAGYWAPELPKNRKVTFQSDVYSFGVLLLELLTGQNPKQDSFSKLVRSVESEEPEAEIFDVKLRREHNVEEMKKLLRIAKNCMSKEPDQRRTMEEVVSMMVDMWPRHSSYDHSKGYDDTPSTDTRDTPSTSTITP